MPVIAKPTLFLLVGKLSMLSTSVVSHHLIDRALMFPEYV